MNDDMYPTPQQQPRGPYRLQGRNGPPAPHYAPPPPQQQPPPQWAPIGVAGGVPRPVLAPQPPTRRNGFGITALALSLIGLLLCLMPITGFLGFILGLLAVLFGALALGRVRRGQASKGLTITALILAVVTTIAGFASM
jgi:hypothetical protein